MNVKGYQYYPQTPDEWALITGLIKASAELHSGPTFPREGTVKWTVFQDECDILHGALKGEFEAVWEGVADPKVPVFFVCRLRGLCRVARVCWYTEHNRSMHSLCEYPQSPQLTDKSLVQKG